MKTRTYEHEVETNGFTDVIDLTEIVGADLTESGLEEGQLLVFVPGATAGITTIEFEPGLLQDLPEFWEALVPSKRNYHHDATWGDGNGFSHLRAALCGPDLTIPFSGGRMILGTWQQIVLLDFDNRPRTRRYVVSLVGE